MKLPAFAIENRRICRISRKLVPEHVFKLWLSPCLSQQLDALKRTKIFVESDRGVRYGLQDTIVERPPYDRGHLQGRSCVLVEPINA